MAECTRPWLANVPLTQLAGASLSSWRRGICAYPARIYAATCIYALTLVYARNMQARYVNVSKRPRTRCIRVRPRVCVHVSKCECDRRIVSARPTYLFTVPASTTSIPSSCTACLACLTDLLLFIFFFPSPSLQHESVSKRHWNSPWQILFLSFLLTPFLSLFN